MGRLHTLARVGFVEWRRLQAYINYLLDMNEMT